MFKHIKIISMLLALCLLTGCAASEKVANEPQAAAPAELVTEESCTSELPEPEHIAQPTPEVWPDDYYIDGPRMAEQTARQELLKMKELGLLADKFYVTERGPDFVQFFTEEPFLQENGKPFISVRWYCDSWYGNNWEGDMPYTVVVNMDPESGKLVYVSIEAAADEYAPVVYEVAETTYDPESGQDVETGETWLYHQNFYDIFPQGMSLAGFCDLLNEYWGFGGWKLGGGGALNTGAPLEEITNGSTGNRYVVFEFEGNPYSNFMYVQIHEFPGRVCLNFGAGHSVG
jgi:hypothetical protein